MTVMSSNVEEQEQLKRKRRNLGNNQITEYD